MARNSSPRRGNSSRLVKILLVSSSPLKSTRKKIKITRRVDFFLLMNKTVKAIAKKSSSVIFFSSSPEKEITRVVKKSLAALFSLGFLFWGAQGSLFHKSVHGWSFCWVGRRVRPFASALLLASDINHADRATEPSALVRSAVRFVQSPVESQLRRFLRKRLFLLFSYKILKNDLKYFVPFEIMTFFHYPQDFK